MADKDNSNLIKHVTMMLNASKRRLANSSDPTIILIVKREIEELEAKLKRIKGAA